MFRLKFLRSAGKVLWLAAVAAFFAACESGPILPVTPTNPVLPPDGYVWREMPVIPGNLPDEQRVVTHRIQVNGRTVRNFSLLYDTREKVSYWVAYPMHPMYKNGNGYRSDDFQYDPFFPSSVQMPITNASYGVSGLTRGHQIPSADRYVTQEANDQTFFITNMTPQNYTFNTEEWASLENWVRATSTGRRDTLYVVTGCVISTAENPAVNYITTRGVRGAVPQAYYKVFLRTASNTTAFPVENDAMCIGVWMEHRADIGSWKNYLKSVSEIERLTGYTFFPAVSSAVKGSYSAAAWGIY